MWDSNLKFENNEFKSIGANTQMYFDISPLALSFDHCAYLAEKRYYFRTDEYFRQSEATVQSTAETTPSATDVPASSTASSTAVQSTASPDTS